MVSDPVRVDVVVRDLAVRDALNQVNRLKDRQIIVPSTSEVVNFARPRVGNEFVKGAHDVITVKLVAYLFALVAVDHIRLTADGNLDQVLKETMEFDTGM